MKKLFLLVLLALSYLSNAQVATKVGYFDMEYILEKLPKYGEAKSKLEEKANTWKQEIELKKGELDKLKKSLEVERIILTKELISEREEEILNFEKELLEFQNNRFGPRGDLVIQKTTIIKPIQDQIFNIVQDIAEKRKYDLIFDKSSDLSIVFASGRFDVSEMILRELLRAEKKETLTKKQQKEQEAKDKLIDDRREDPRIVEKEKAQEEKQKQILNTREERQRALEERKAEAERKRLELQEAKKQAIEDRKAEAERKRLELQEKKQNAAARKTTNNTLLEDDKSSQTKAITNEKAEVSIQSIRENLSDDEKQNAIEQQKAEAEQKRIDQQEARKKALDDRKAEAERKRLELQEAKQKAIEQRKAEAEKKRLEIEERKKTNK